MDAPDRTLRGFVGYDMKRAFAAIQSDVNATLAPFGLRMVTFSVLVIIRDNPGLKQTQLAEILMIERPNLVVILDELEKAGFVTRRRAPDDRRAYELTVTIKGRRQCDRAVEAVAQHDARMVEGMDEAALDALHAGLRRIEANGRSSDDRRKVSRS
ncbi:MAG: MarR family winged helix-turn-helix transcriptional regulator [Pararhodobacter sp.]